MYKTAIEKLRDFILSKNAYLSHGFANAYSDDTGVYAKVGGNTANIFPADRYGNYFYLKAEGNTSFNDDQRFNLSDRAKAGVMSNPSVSIVAIMADADPETLTVNILSTLAEYQRDITVTTGSWDREAIVRDELKALDKADIEASLARIKKTSTLVKLTFSLPVEVSFIKTSCIKNPCEQC